MPNKLAYKVKEYSCLWPCSSYKLLQTLIWLSGINTGECEMKLLKVVNVGRISYPS